MRLDAGPGVFELFQNHRASLQVCCRFASESSIAIRVLNWKIVLNSKEWTDNVILVDAEFTVSWRFPRTEDIIILRLQLWTMSMFGLIVAGRLVSFIWKFGSKFCCSNNVWLSAQTGEVIVEFLTRTNVVFLCMTSRSKLNSNNYLVTLQNFLSKSLKLMKWTTL